MEKFIINARWKVDAEFEVEAETREEAEDAFFHDVFYGGFEDLPKGHYVQGSFKIDTVKREEEYDRLERLPS